MIVVGDESPARTLRTDQATIPIDVVATAGAFPGMSFQRPLVVADSKLLRHAFSTAGGGDPLLDPSVFAQLWVKGPDGPAARALAATSVRPDPILTAGQVLKQPDFTAFTRTFAFMKSLGFGAGFLAVVAILLYLQARQRNRVVSFALSRRMGLGAGEHRLALVLELGGMLLAAFVIAVVLALAAARLLFARIEPLASLSPVLLFDVPFALILGALLALVAVSLAGGLLANRTAEHANLAEVMRLEA